MTLTRYLLRKFVGKVRRIEGSSCSRGKTMIDAT